MTKYRLKILSFHRIFIGILFMPEKATGRTALQSFLSIVIH